MSSKPDSISLADCLVAAFGRNHPPVSSVGVYTHTHLQIQKIWIEEGKKVTEPAPRVRPTQPATNLDENITISQKTQSHPSNPNSYTAHTYTNELNIFAAVWEPPNLPTRLSI